MIKDRVYTAFFDEKGVVLKAREKKGDAEDLVIPIRGTRDKARQGDIPDRGWCGYFLGLSYFNSDVCLNMQAAFMRV